MKQFIYITEFPVGPDATEKQECLFNADLGYAISQGYEFVQTPDGKVFQIIPETNDLVEVDVTEEYLQNLAETQQAMEELDELEDDGYCKVCHNISMIDDIINNSLRVDSAITPQQADTMLKLAHLKKVLMDIE